MIDAGDRDQATADHGFFGGRLQLRQYCQGHRAGTDAVLLASAVVASPGECLIDVGAGVGAAGLAVLSRAPGTRAVLVERDSSVAALASHNSVRNGMRDRVSVATVDIFDQSSCRTLSLMGAADIVVSNPPFFKAGTVRPSHKSRRSEAHILDQGGHGEWLKRLTAFLKPKGRAYLIHRPDAVPDLLATGLPLGALRLFPVLPRMGQDAVRIVLELRLGSKAPFRLLPPLVLHETDGSFTPEADRLHRGEAWLMTKKERPA